MNWKIAPIREFQGFCSNAPNLQISCVAFINNVNCGGSGFINKIKPSWEIQLRWDESEFRSPMKAKNAKWWSWQKVMKGNAMRWNAMSWDRGKELFGLVSDEGLSLWGLSNYRWNLPMGLIGVGTMDFK